jgi:hypothetical protein
MRFSDITWWYWAATDLLLAAYLWGWTPGIALAMGLTFVQMLHFTHRTGSLRSFPVQVRTGYFALLAIGLWPSAAVVHWVQLFGTLAMVTADYCLLARLTSLLPWNRKERFSYSLVTNTLFSPPGKLGPTAAVAERGCRDGGLHLTAPRPIRTTTTR